MGRLRPGSRPNQNDYVFFSVIGFVKHVKHFITHPNRPWADGGPHAPPHYLHSLVFSFTPGSVDLEKAC